MERISDERLKELMDDCEADSGCVFHDRDRDLASALRELVRLREGWVSVKDRLPEVDRGNRYFGICAFVGQPFVPVIFFAKSEPSAIAGRFFCAFGRRKETWFSIQGTRFEADEVSHWMPLPAPPVIEKQGVPVVDVPKVGE